mgnify:CR=1 FL=1
MAKRFSRDWVRRIASDLKDNIPSIEAPPLHESEASISLRERLFPLESQRRILELTKNFEVNVPYGITTIVGNAREGTRHVHRFIVERSDAGVELLFVDPEDYIGKKHLARPRVVNLVQMKLNQNEPPETAILRHRTHGVRDASQNQLDVSIDSLSMQEQNARELLANDAIPEILKGHEQEITFRFITSNEKTLLQSRYLDEGEGEDFLAGGSSPTIEAKLDAHLEIISRFVRLLEAGQLQPNGQHKISKRPA